MKLSGNDVRAIAYEARLPMPDDELESYVRFINDFLNMAGKLKELDLRNVPPFRFPESPECPLREDVPERFDGIPEILQARDGAYESALFKVPRIMEE